MTQVLYILVSVLINGAAKTVVVDVTPHRSESACEAAKDLAVTAPVSASEQLTLMCVRKTL